MESLPKPAPKSVARNQHGNDPHHRDTLVQYPNNRVSCNYPYSPHHGESRLVVTDPTLHVTPNTFRLLAESFVENFPKGFPCLPAL